MPRGVIAGALWVIFFTVMYKLAMTTTKSKVYDPFLILGLAQVSERYFVSEIVKLEPVCYTDQ